MGYVEFNKIFTLIYKPFYFKNEDNILGEQADFVNISNSNATGNRYFTIIDVLYADTLTKITNRWNSVIQNKSSGINDTLVQFLVHNRDFTSKVNIDDYLIFSDNNYELYNNLNVIFVLKDEINSDTVYCLDYNKFILVPYFTKQKQMFEGNYLIRVSNDNYYEENSNEAFDYRYVEKYEDKEGNLVSTYKKVKIELNSKWLCTEVTLLKPTNKLSYILKNDNDEQITLFSLNRFILDKDYIKQEADKKLQQQQLIANKKRDELLKNEKEKKDFEKQKMEFTSRYGQQYGELIANNKVKIGMTSEMCKSSWGSPIWTNKLTTENGTFEVWHCGSGYKLYFANDILKIIEE